MRDACARGCEPCTSRALHPQTSPFAAMVPRQPCQHRNVTGRHHSYGAGLQQCSRSPMSADIPHNQIGDAAVQMAKPHWLRTFAGTSMQIPGFEIG